MSSTPSPAKIEVLAVLGSRPLPSTSREVSEARWPHTFAAGRVRSKKKTRNTKSRRTLNTPRSTLQPVYYRGVHKLIYKSGCVSKLVYTTAACLPHAPRPGKGGAGVC